MCLFCEKIMPGLYRLEQHMTTHTFERPYFCQNCDETWPTAKALYRHNHAVHLEIKYKCSECHLLSDTYEKFRKHRRCVHEVNIMENGKRSIVGEMVKIQGDAIIPFEKQARIKIEPMPRRKRKRGKRNIRKNKLGIQFDCLFCGKAWKERRQLEMHMNSHTGEMPFDCSKCGYAFPCRYTVYKHKKICTAT